jgi:metal-responsive CopG/Arc/MetJ family transcriptional regulator
MKNEGKIKRININIPVYILDEIDTFVGNEAKTRTEIFVMGAKLELQRRKRQKKLHNFLSRDEAIFNKTDNREIFRLGTNEWVKKLRQEGEK